MISIVDQLPQQLWRDYVDKHPQGRVFHTPEMHQVFEKAKKHVPILRAAVDESGHLLALFPPVQVTVDGIFPRRLTTRAVAYGSLLYNQDETGRKAVEALLHSYTEEVGGQTLLTELRNLSDLSAIQPVLIGCGFEYEDHLNFLIDLDRSVKKVMQSIGSRTRKNIRRGLRKDEIVIEEIIDRNKISVAYDLIQKSYAYAQVPLADQSLFQAAFDVLHPKDMVKFWLARLDDVYVGASVELLHRDVMYGWYGGVDRDYSSHVPGELLTWHILKWGAEHGYRMYDFGGAGKPDEDYGVRDFKAKFGGKLVCFGRNTYVHSPLLLRISEVGYQVYRRLL
jgi:hypothetical protein